MRNRAQAQTSIRLLNVQVQQRCGLRFAGNEAYFTLPPQSECPQRQTISVLFPIPSQWGLQYLAFLGGMQLQAAFAHFFAGAIGTSFLPADAVVHRQTCQGE